MGFGLGSIKVLVGDQLSAVQRYLSGSSADGYGDLDMPGREHDIKSFHQQLVAGLVSEGVIGGITKNHAAAGWGTAAILNLRDLNVVSHTSRAGVDPEYDSAKAGLHASAIAGMVEVASLPFGGGEVVGPFGGHMIAAANLVGHRFPVQTEAVWNAPGHALHGITSMFGGHQYHTTQDGRGFAN